MKILRCQDDECGHHLGQGRERIKVIYMRQSEGGKGTHHGE